MHPAHAGPQETDRSYKPEGQTQTIYCVSEIFEYVRQLLAGMIVAGWPYGGKYFSRLRWIEDLIVIFAPICVPR